MGSNNNTNTNTANSESISETPPDSTLSPESAPETPPISATESTSGASLDPAPSPKSTPAKEKGPSALQRFKALFTKNNPHYKRNRSILALSFAAPIALIPLIIALCITPSLDGNITILNVTPTSIDDGIIGADTHFLIETEYGSIEKVRNAIYLEPAIDYEITEVAPGLRYEIIPASPLADNTIFNVDSVSNEVVAYKWAFQTKKDLSVSKIYPANGANYVSENTVIEFSFSYPDVENVADHFSISPQVAGNLEKLERSWRFTPESPLEQDTTYEITISAGLTYGDETMAKDYHSSFSTHERALASSDDKSEGITLDGVSYFTETETPIVVFSNNDRDYFYNSESITIEKIQNADDYIKYLKGEQITGEEIGSFEFEKSEESERSPKLAILKQTLPTGYYIFHFKSADGQNLHTADIEVNNLSAYAFESERDALVWAAENGELKSGIKVNFRGQEYETGSDGLLTIENISNYSDELEYLKIGDPAQPLVVALKNFRNDLYPRGFIYTDRPLYTPSDTIKFWGYVPLAFFKDSPKLDNFSVTFDKIKQTVTVDSEGFFSGEIKLENHKDISNRISLVYNDLEIANRYITIENYSLENYTYEFISDKNYVNAGENINFSIRVSHVTGFPAINKDIVVIYDEHDYYATTDGTGEASFSLSTQPSTATWDSSSSYTTEYIQVKSGGAEYNKYSTGTTFFIFKNNMELRGTKVSGKDQIEFTAETLNLSEPVKTDFSFKNLAKSNYSGPATLRLYETRYQRDINGYSYNEYTKENTPIYHTSSSTSIIQEIPVTITDGKLIYDYPTDFKDPEANVYYYYSAAISVTDSTGRPAFSYKVNYYSNYYLGESSYLGRNAVVSWLYNPTSDYLYNLYRFGLKDTTGTSPYSINDTLNLGLYDYSDANVENTGQVLAVAFKESIISTNIFKDNTMDITFDHTLYPGFDIIGAYFKDGKFYRIAPNYFDYDETDSELTVKVESDKSSYMPGDTVKAKITVTRPDGSRANGKVNLSVVNEAIFNAVEDNTSILSSIYANKSFKFYSMSTFRDYELFLDGGGMGSAMGGRSDFGDTIFFGSQELSNGETEFEFKLNDSITSFRLTALAVENGDVINAGAGTAKVVSSLPLSISTVIPKKVKKTDDLVLNANSITSVGDSIDYTFTIEELGKTLGASATPGQSVTVNFGKLDLGTYTITISAKDSAGNTDQMMHTIDIIETAQEVAVKNIVEIDQDVEITPTRNPIIVEFYDKETKDYVTFLDFLDSNQSVRLDTLIGYYKSLEYRNKYYDEEVTVSAPSFDVYVATDGSLRPLESAESDYILTALANYYTPDYFKLKPENYDLNLDDDISTVIEKLLVLASFKEPVLLELRNVENSSFASLSEDEKALLGIAFAFVGDYNSAKSIYRRIQLNSARGDLLAILSSFIDKSETASRINNLIRNEPASDYLSFAILSFFENNEIDLTKRSTIETIVNSETTQIDISPLEVVKEVYFSNDLGSLKFSPKQGNVLAYYYYQGGISELGEGYTADIVAQLEDINVGQTGALLLDISALADRNGTLNIALPASLKFSATFSGQDGLYLSLNNNEYIKLSLTDRYADNIIRIPLYVATPGNYELEPIIFTGENGNHISESIIFDIR